MWHPPSRKVKQPVATTGGDRGVSPTAQGAALGAQGDVASSAYIFVAIQAHKGLAETKGKGKGADGG